MFALSKYTKSKPIILHILFIVYRNITFIPMNLIDLFNTRIWLLDPLFVERVQPVIIHLYNKGQLEIPRIGEQPEREIENPKNKPKDMVAHVPIWGTMTKRGGLSAEGTQSTINKIDTANRDDSIVSILLDIESGGGTVDGMTALGQSIKQSRKPVVAYVDQVAASAAYWAASQADTIVMNESNYAKVGSIGALMIHQDSTKMIADKIGKIEIIRAPQSKDKARVNPVESLPKLERDKIISDLKAITDDFIGQVKQGRGDRLNTSDENIFTGKMYGAEEAQNYGMVDHLGDFKSAVNISRTLGIVVKEAIENNLISA